MRLTEPLVFDPSDPLAQYDAYAFALLSYMNQDPTISELGYLRNGPRSEEILRWTTGAYGRFIKKLAEEAEERKGPIPKDATRRYVIRDLDMDVPLPEWNGERLYDGGMSDEERAIVREKLKGRGQIIAFSEWSWKPSDWVEKDEEREKEAKAKREQEKSKQNEQNETDPSLRPPPPQPSGGNKELQDLFMNLIMAMRRKLVGGKEHYILQNLLTLPSHFRNGAGKKLVQVILPEIDEEKALCYLDASPMGYPVYLKCDFKEIDHIEIDKDKWGGHGIHKHIGMFRYPGGIDPATTETNGV